MSESGARIGDLTMNPRLLDLCRRIAATKTTPFPITFEDVMRAYGDPRVR